MDHSYSLPFAARSAAEAVPAKRKRTGEANDPRRSWDRKRAKTRVNIGVAFPRWRELRDKLGLQRDADLACVLLESYRNVAPSFSTPGRRPGLLSRALSGAVPSGSPSSGSLSPLRADDGSAVADDAARLHNTVVDWDDDDTWETATEDSSSDEDVVPSICLRIGGGIKALSCR